MIKATKEYPRCEDLSLFTSGNRLTLASVFLHAGMKDTVATFDLLVRELPPHRNFLVFAGLEYIVEYLQNLRFTEEQIKQLNCCYNFDPATLAYLKRFRFTGKMWALPEGSIFFPQEPIIRITAPLIEAQLIEMFLINAAYFPTIFASKMARFVAAAKGTETVIAYNRSYGVETALKSERIKYMLGSGGGCALYAHLNDITGFATGTHHYLMQSFADEGAAFRTYLKQMRGRGYVLVDTYDTPTGIKRFIKVAHELKREGIKVSGIQIDSGDRLALSKLARRLLDQADLKHVKIFIMGNLDEYKVAGLVKHKAPVNVYAGGTELLTPSDAPTLELIYKLAELQAKGKVHPKMKTSPGKLSLPGQKQVWRVSKNNKYHHDVIGLASEKLPGQKLLTPIIKNGKLIRRLPTLKQISAHYQREIKKFPPRLSAINQSASYPVRISPTLKALTEKTKKTIS